LHWLEVKMEEQLDTRREKTVAIVVLLLLIVALSFIVTYGTQKKQARAEKEKLIDISLSDIQRQLIEVKDEVKQPVVVQTTQEVSQETIDAIERGILSKLPVYDKKYDCIYVQNANTTTMKLSCTFAMN
jgi:uncharacterized ion transporter superfamily protein YfcC